MERDIVIGVYKARSGNRTVTLEALQETALCHGWVDTQNKRIDEERYAIRFVPRRAGTDLGTEEPTDGAPDARGRPHEAGLASLPDL